ncbi:hypothetical protein [Thiomicrorhabdus sp.]|uniref:hypothetical protein n=1 Tax=Thiomicrorhabdus sp. TaxID=2039724 RepID=UPI0029C95B84|nr:hypothetical protein [Thiomicrorhabdus sp.]
MKKIIGMSLLLMMIGTQSAFAQDEYVPGTATQQAAAAGGAGLGTAGATLIGIGLTAAAIWAVEAANDEANGTTGTTD